MTPQEADAFRLEAAEQYGFEEIENAHTTAYRCTEAELIAFAKACERKGLFAAIAALRSAEAKLDAAQSLNASLMSGAISAMADTLDEALALIDAELTPIREAAEARFMTAQGYVRGPDAPGERWVKP